jgi:hypothetical protein
VTEPPWIPDTDTLRARPILGHLAAIAHQLDLMVAALTAEHSGAGSTSSLTIQARSMVLAATVLQRQIAIYRHLLDVQGSELSPEGTVRLPR